MKSRILYYLLSLGIGAVYLALFALAHAYLGFTGWVPTIDWIFFIFSIAIVIVFFIKDAIDEKNMGRGGTPVGPSWFEHGPFILVIAFQTAMSIYFDTDPLISYIKVIVFFIAMVDYLWDLSQDERSGRSHCSE